MGGQLGEDLKNFGLGLQKGFSKRKVEGVSARKNLEAQTRQKTILSLADEGLFHNLDQKSAKALVPDKELFEALRIRSQTVEESDRPRKEAQRDILSLVNQDVKFQSAPGGTVGIQEPTTTSQVSVPQQAPLLQPQQAQALQQRQGTQAPAAPVTQPIGPLVTPRELGRRIPHEPALTIPPAPQTTIQPLVQPTQGITVTTEPQINIRSPRAAERVARIEGLSPVGIALAYNDNALGTLALQTLQSKTAEGRLQFDRSKQAYIEMRPKYHTTVDGLDASGNRVHVGVFSMPDGTTQRIPFGRGAGSGATQQALNTLRVIEDKLLDPNLTPDQRDELETQAERQHRAFNESLRKSQTNVNLPEQAVAVTGQNGEYLGHVLPSDEVGQRHLRNLGLAQTISSKPEVLRDRNVLYEGANALALINDITAIATPLNTGIIASLVSTGQSLATLIKTSPQIYSTFSNLIGVARSELQNAQDKKFANRILGEFDASPDFLDASVKALAVILAKVRDPSTGVREGEYNTTIRLLIGEGIRGAGFPGFMARMEVARRDVIRRMTRSYDNQQATIATVRQLLGDPNAVVPIIDPSRTLPREVTHPGETEQRSSGISVPGLPPLPTPQGGAAAPTRLTQEQFLQRQQVVEAHINEKLRLQGLNAIPPPVMEQLSAFTQRQPGASAGAVLAAFDLMLDNWEKQNATR